jgi:DNA-binding response OmpR family regulator
MDAFPRRILLVEDDGPTRRALRGILMRMGWEVGVADTVSKAIAQLRLRPAPTCLILDLMLPDGRGEEVLEFVREQSTRRDPLASCTCRGRCPCH